MPATIFVRMRKLSNLVNHIFCTVFLSREPSIPAPYGFVLFSLWKSLCGTLNLWNIRNLKPTCFTNWQNFLEEAVRIMNVSIFWWSACVWERISRRRKTVAMPFFWCGRLKIYVFFFNFNKNRLKLLGGSKRLIFFKWKGIAVENKEN